MALYCPAARRGGVGPLFELVEPSGVLVNRKRHGLHVGTQARNALAHVIEPMVNVVEPTASSSRRPISRGCLR
jgi:hypothetical protein